VLSPDDMKIASCALGKELHSVFLSDTGTIFHCIRHEAGAWDKWEMLHPGGIFKDVTCASVEPDLHVIGVKDDGLCVHRMRDKDGKWTEFSELPHQPMFEGFGPS